MASVGLVAGRAASTGSAPAHSASANGVLHRPVVSEDQAPSSRERCRAQAHIVGDSRWPPLRMVG
jgi:hypothetical protein